MASNNKIDVIIRLLYQQSSNAKRVIADLNKVTQATKLLGSAMGRLKIAAQFYISFRIFSAIYRVVNALTSAIPDLIKRGEEWAAVLNNIQDLTGMTAEQTGKLAGVARLVGADVNKLGRDIAYLGRNVIENEAHFARFGIRVRDANGDLKTSYEIFQNVRRAISEYGRGFLSTAAAQRIFSEGGRDLLELLMLTQPQWQRLTRQARQAGLIMSQAALNAAKAWERTRFHIDSVITGLGAQILGGVAPVLSALVAGITNTIQQNMASIVDFVQRVVVIIAGFIAGLFDLEIKWKAVERATIDHAQTVRDAAGANIDYGRAADTATAADDRHRAAIDKQTDALDRRIARLDRIMDRRRARREYQELKRDIREARLDLQRTRSKVIFASGMSGVEAELARQAHARDIIDGEKRLAQARRRLRQHERDEELQAKKDRLQRQRDSMRDQLGDLASAGTKLAAAGAGMADSVTRGLQKVPKAIKGIKGETFKLSAELKEMFKGAQEGGRGFLQHLQNLAGIFLDIIDRIKELMRLAGIDVRTEEEKYRDALTKRQREKERGGDPILTREGADEAARQRFGPQVANEILNSNKRYIGYEEFWEQGAKPALQRAQDEATQRTLRGSEPPPPAPYRRQNLGRVTNPRDARAESMGRDYVARMKLVDSWFQLPPGAGFAGQMPTEKSTANTWRSKETPEEASERTFRRYFGRSSDHYKAQASMMAELNAILGNTDALSGEINTKTIIKKWNKDSGKVDVLNPDIGRVNRWDAGRLGTSVNNWAAGQLVGIQGNVGANVKAWQAGQLVGIQGNVGVWNSGWKARFDNIGRIDNWNAGQQVQVKSNKGSLNATVWQQGTVAVKGNLTQIQEVKKLGKIENRSVVTFNNIGAISRLKELKVRAGLLLTRIDAIQQGLINIKISGVSIKFGQQGGMWRAGTTAVVGEAGPELVTFPTAPTVHSHTASKQMARQMFSGGGNTPMKITLQLDPATTRLLLSGRPVNTSTRAAVGQ